MIMNLVELKAKKIDELTSMARKSNIEGATGMHKQDLIFDILLLLNDWPYQKKQQDEKFVYLKMRIFNIDIELLNLCGWTLVRFNEVRYCGYNIFFNAIVPMLS